MALYSPFKIMALCALFQAAAGSYALTPPQSMVWSQPGLVPTFTVSSGPCTVKSDGCVYSDSFGPGQEYANNQDCIIKLGHWGKNDWNLGWHSIPFKLDVRSFDVEGYYDVEGYNEGYFALLWALWEQAGRHFSSLRCRFDYLEVNGIRYCDKEGPHGVTPSWSKAQLVWHTDYSVTRAGFKICVLDPGGRPWF